MRRRRRRIDDVFFLFPGVEKFIPFALCFLLKKPGEDQREILPFSASFFVSFSLSLLSKTLLFLEREREGEPDNDQPVILERERGMKDAFKEKSI